MKVPESVIERMAEAAWNVQATIPWAEFFDRHPSQRLMYLDQMRAALAVVRMQDVLIEAKEKP